MPDVCGTCKALVVFAWTPTGAQAIIDRDPVEDGNTLLLRHSQFGLLAVTLSKDALKRARELHVPLWVSHWATCEQREQWRERMAERRATSGVD